ncbi:MAG: STAS domain-containing protein [Pirellulaceae bacterium]|nr:STAS domain-containing protein [Pirellulaceae bacterium]
MQNTRPWNHDSQLHTALIIAWDGSQQTLRDAVQRLPYAPSQREVALDCSEVDTLRTEQLGALIQFRRGLQERNYHLRLCELRPTALEVLHLTRLDRMLDISALETEPR